MYYSYRYASILVTFSEVCEIIRVRDILRPYSKIINDRRGRIYNMKRSASECIGMKSDDCNSERHGKFEWTADHDVGIIDVN